MKTMVLVYIPFPDKESAQDFAKEALSLRLAACANLLPQTESLYFWEAELKNEKECILILKTLPSYYHKILKFARKKHPYKVPAIIRIKAMVNNDYYHWVKNTLQSKNPKLK